MKAKLLNARLSFSEKERRVLSQEELSFITGGNAILSGSGTSSTSGACCCDATCVCKKFVEDTQRPVRREKK